MRAIQITEFNGPLQLAEVEAPVAGSDELLVTLTLAAVNPLDVWACQGNFSAVTKLPHIPGAEGLGRAENGELGLVNGAGIGISRPGTYAQLVTVPVAAWIPISAEIPSEIAVSMAIAGVTAWQSLNVLAKVRSDDTVLVLGASGGVGSLAAQLARNVGSTVIGQSSNRAKTASVEALGVESIVAANGEQLVEALGDRKVSVVIDGLGGTFTPAAISCMLPFGRLVNYGTSAGVDVTLQMRNLYRNGITVFGYTGLLLTVEQKVAALKSLFAEFAAERLVLEVSDVLPLSEANDAHRRILAREVTGKVVLDVTR